MALSLLKKQQKGLEPGKHLAWKIEGKVATFLMTTFAHCPQCFLFMASSSIHSAHCNRYTGLYCILVKKAEADGLCIQYKISPNRDETFSGNNIHFKEVFTTHSEKVWWSKMR